MKIRMTLLLFVALPLVTVEVTQAQTGGWDLWELSYAERAYTGPETAVVMVLPDGSGAALTNAAIVGSTVDASITLYLLDWAMAPVANFPREDMWIESADGGLAMCAAGTIADANTNANGEAFWVQPLRAGGASEALTVVMINGAALVSGAGLAISFNSPDINGDGVVNLTDVTLFTTDFYGGVYAFRSDFHYDWSVNLSDVLPLVHGLGSSCP
jgi:hypothetical protein